MWALRWKARRCSCQSGFYDKEKKHQSLKNCQNFKFIFDEKLLRRFNLFTSKKAKKAAKDEGCCLAEAQWSKTMSKSETTTVTTQLPLVR